MKQVTKTQLEDIVEHISDNIGGYLYNSAAQNIAPTEATTTTSQKYEIGEQFYYDKILYTATAFIANGGTIVTSGENKNCEPSPTLTKQLAALGTAATKNSTSVVTSDSTDLPTGGAVKDLVGWGNKNLWINNAFTSNTKTTVGITVTINDDKSLTITGSNTTSGNNVVECGAITLKAGTYYLSGAVGGSYDIRLQVFRPGQDWYDAGNGISITLGEDTEVKLRVWFTANAQNVNKHFYPQIEVGTTATAYEPYHASVEEYIPQVVSDAVGWDVGNLITGVVENYSIIADGTVTPDNAFMYTDGSIVKPYHNYRFKAQSIDTTSTNIRIHGYNSSGTWVKQIIAVSGATTTADIKFYIDDPSIVSVKISLKKAFTEHTLTHFTVDEQKADNSVIAPIENGSNASQAWSVGQHFMNGGVLKEVTNAIANGEAITGSNTKDVTVADCLVKQATFSGTTDSTGNVKISDDNSINILIGFSLNRICIPFQSSSGTYLKVTAPHDMSPYASQAVNGTYYYI